MRSWVPAVAIVFAALGLAVIMCVKERPEKVALPAPDSPAAIAARPSPDTPPPAPPTVAAVARAVVPPVPAENEDGRSKIENRKVAPAIVPPLPAEMSNVPAATVLENMRATLRLYAGTFDGNPVGNNAEITASLNGQNPKQITFLKSDGNRVNSQGELVDIWGTPYFFHQLAAHEMEIRSAGPDRRMWTPDDVVIK